VSIGRLPVVFAILATVLGIAFAFATPPYRVPDEAGHFWHAEALARGVVVPAFDRGQPSAIVPDLDGRPMRAHFTVYFTPLPHLPQTLGCVIANALHLRAFYAGRLCNLAAFIALMTTAMRLAPRIAPLLCAIGLLPMTLFLAASYSPDPMTIAIAALVAAFIADRKDSPWLIALGAALALVKPAYVPIATMAFVVRARHRYATAAATLVSLAGTIALLRRTYSFADHEGVHVDPRAQLAFLRAHPLSFLATAISDYAHHAPRYAAEFAGRLGHLDVALPFVVIAAALLVVLAGALACNVEWNAWQRAAGVAIVIAVLLLVSASQYLNWTAPGARAILGIQGRYFLPLAPLALALLGRAWRVPAWLAPVVLAIADVVAIALTR
jgi:uncharacterized membrane protein